MHRYAAGTIDRGEPVAVNDRKPWWYTLPPYILGSGTYVVAMVVCVAAFGAEMTGARWLTAGLISLAVSVGLGFARGFAQGVYDELRR